ncbi:DUF3108 domain-containing protein [Luteimonas pelagia]
MRSSTFRPIAHALLLALALGAAATGFAGARDQPRHAAVEAAAGPLAPFQAEYAVHRAGKRFGDARLTLAPANGADWRVSLDIDATRGLFGLAGLDAHQRTDFRVDGGEFRPLVQHTRREALFLDRTSTGRYDWRALDARWSGDVSDKRKAPVRLHAGDLSSLLVNLAVVRDAAPGATLDYRVVDNGRARGHRYVVSAEKESISIEGIGYHALRVERTDKRDEQTVFWIADGVPTPIRILQREDGEDTFDLRLVDYRGA